MPSKILLGHVSVESFNAIIDNGMLHCPLLRSFTGRAPFDFSSGHALRL
jgi:hypothetical protein